MPYEQLFDGTFVKNARSGFGLEYWLPKHPKSLDKIDTNLNYQPAFFDNMGEVATKLVESEGSGILIWGEPGAGKSHFRDDTVVRFGAMQGVPFLSISLHINAGKSTGHDNAQAAIDELKDCGTGRKLVFFDNVDFLGYRGTHRTRRGTANYAKAMGCLIESALDDPQLAVVGTAHDQDWRQGKWTWHDDEIDAPAQNALDAFPNKFELTGELTSFGLEDVISERGLTNPDAYKIMLRQRGMTSFFWAMHLDPGLFINNPEAAMNEITTKRAALKLSTRTV